MCSQSQLLNDGAREHKQVCDELAALQRQSKAAAVSLAVLYYSACLRAAAVKFTRRCFVRRKTQTSIKGCPK